MILVKAKNGSTIPLEKKVTPQTLKYPINKFDWSHASTSETPPKPTKSCPAPFHRCEKCLRWLSGPPNNKTFTIEKHQIGKLCKTGENFVSMNRDGFYLAKVTNPKLVLPDFEAVMRKTEYGFFYPESVAAFFRWMFTESWRLTREEKLSAIKGFAALSETDRIGYLSGVLLTHDVSLSNF